MEYHLRRFTFPLIAIFLPLCIHAKFGETLSPDQQAATHPNGQSTPPLKTEVAESPSLVKREPNATFFGYPLTSLKGGLSLGFIFMPKPELDWTNGERQLLIIDGSEADVITESKEFKNAMGISVEYSHFLQQGVFLGVGADVWKKTTAKTNDKASMWPMMSYLNVGLFQSFQGDQGFVKLFGGIGVGRIGYDYDYVGVNYSAFLGLMYQFGIGIIYRSFFMDITFRNIQVRYHEDADIPINSNTELASYRKRGKVGLDTPMLRLGFFF